MLRMGALEQVVLLKSWNKVERKCLGILERQVSWKGKMYVCMFPGELQGLSTLHGAGRNLATAEDSLCLSILSFHVAILSNPYGLWNSP